MGYVNIPVDLSNYIKSNNGNYAGNNTINRAVPHGLGKIPADIEIAIIGDGRVYQIKISGRLDFISSIDDQQYTVTAADDTNFYVGNATHYGMSANSTGETFYWIVKG